MPAKTINPRWVLCAAIGGALIASSASASEKSCEDEMPEIAALIQSIPGSADRNTAAHQYKKAQEKLAEGNERRCLLYLESARAAVEAEQMHDN